LDAQLSLASSLGFTLNFIPSSLNKALLHREKAMSIASQTFGLPTSHSVRHGGSFAAIGARAWLNVLARVKAYRAASAERAAERELLSLAEQYEASMPSFAAELRAANARRV
jgi:hypothetical protein